jgi:dephospho-CoA kinase
MKKVGITGGIGSGKTTVSHFFNILNVPVFNADVAAASILLNDQELHRQLIDLLGEEMMKEGKPDKKYIATKIFSNPELLHRMNALVHPKVRLAFEKWCETRKNHPYLLKEAAILFESGTYKELDKIILVSSPMELRKIRTSKRSGMSAEEFDKRVNNQWDDERKRTLADAEIINDEKHSIILQVLNLHKQLHHDSNTQQ